MKKIDLEIGQLRSLLGFSLPESQKWIGKSGKNNKFSSLSHGEKVEALRQRQRQKLEEYLGGIRKELKRVMKRVCAFQALKAAAKKSTKESVSLKGVDLDVEAESFVCDLMAECGYGNLYEKEKGIEEATEESDQTKAIDQTKKAIEERDQTKAKDQINISTQIHAQIQKEIMHHQQISNFNSANPNSTKSSFSTFTAIKNWKVENAKRLSQFLKYLYNEKPKEEQQASSKSTKSHSVANSPKKRPFPISTVNQPRKNRPGQRARRQEWERLHGENARHLLAKQSSFSTTPAANEVKQQEFNNVEKPKELHPSWAAKLSLQKKASEVNFVGKKVVFSQDDDDEE